jgi:hypothetical protein
MISPWGCNPSASTEPHPPKIYPLLYCSLLNDGLAIETKMNSLIDLINGWLVVFQRKISYTCKFWFFFNESLTAVNYSCISNGQIWKLHPMSWKKSPTGEKKFTQRWPGSLENGWNRNRQRVGIISLLATTVHSRAGHKLTNNTAIGHPDLGRFQPPGPSWLVLNQTWSRV